MNAPRALACLAVIALAACSQPPPASSTPAKAAPAAAGNSGKPSAPVHIVFVAAGKPQAGVPFPIEVHVAPASAVDSMRIEIAGDEGLTLIGDAKALDLAAKPGVTHVEYVSVQPSRDRGLLRVTVITSVGGQERRKVVVYPVLLAGAGAAAPEKPVEVTPEGERIITLPAEESD